MYCLSCAFSASLATRSDFSGAAESAAVAAELFDHAFCAPFIRQSSFAFTVPISVASSFTRFISTFIFSSILLAISVARSPNRLSTAVFTASGSVDFRSVSRSALAFCKVAAYASSCLRLFLLRIYGSNDASPATIAEHEPVSNGSIFLLKYSLADDALNSAISSSSLSFSSLFSSSSVLSVSLESGGVVSSVFDGVVSPVSPVSVSPEAADVSIAVSACTLLSGLIVKTNHVMTNMIRIAKMIRDRVFRDKSFRIGMLL